MILRRGEWELALNAGPSRPVLSVNLPPVGGIKMSSAISYMPTQHFLMMVDEFAKKTHVWALPLYWTRIDDRTIRFYPIADKDYEVVARDAAGILLTNPDQTAKSVEQYVKAYSELEAVREAEYERQFAPRVERFDRRSDEQ